MTRRQETAVDMAEYTVGGTLFFIVSAVTAAVMAVGFLGITIAERLRD